MSLAQACHIIYGSEIDKTQHLYEIIVLNFIIPGDPQKSTPLISLKKCAMLKRNIFISVFICTKFKHFRLHIGGDIQHIENIYLVFHV